MLGTSEKTTSWTEAGGEVILPGHQFASQYLWVTPFYSAPFALPSDSQIKVRRGYL